MSYHAFPRISSRPAARAQEQQQYEIEALQAIYGDDFQTEKEVWGNPSFSLRIKPIAFEPDEIFSEAKLLITYSKTYPKSAPKIDVVEHKGFSDKEKEELVRLLGVVAKNSVGDVMVHQLACETGERRLQRSHGATFIHRV